MARSALSNLSSIFLLTLFCILPAQAADRAIAVIKENPGSMSGLAPNSSYPADTTIFQAVPNVEKTLIGWTEYNTWTCEVVDTGTWSATASPTHGTNRFGIENRTVTSGPCAGAVWPFNFAYYTWTDTAGTALEDFFSLSWYTADGYYDDSDWLAQSSSGEDKNSGHNCPACFDGNPINAGTGNKFQVETDFVGGAATHLALTRYYNSQDATGSALGIGWHSTWHRGLSVSGKTVTIAREDGREDTFTKNASGVWVADPDVTSVLTPVPATGTQTGWKLVRDDDSVERYALSGLLSSVTTREGLATTLAYNAKNQLATVAGPFGHKLAFTYDANGHVQQMTTPDGQLYAYGYDSNNNLTSVTYPDKTVRQYVYENTTFKNALTGIVDELGNRFATYGYDTLGRATTTQHAGGVELTTVAYNADGSSTVTDSRSNAHTYALKTQFSMVKPAAVTGTPVPNAGAQAYTYDANGFVASRTDFNGHVTAYTRDARGLELSRTEAKGTPQARTIKTVWHPTFHLPTQITEPSGVAGINRVTTLTYDSVQGTLLKKTVAAGSLSRTWAYTYNTAGQPKTLTDPNGNVTALGYDAKGGLASVTNALGQVTTYTNDTDGRPVSSTDPNGLVTKIAYTARGQVASQTVGQEVTSYAHDLAGNLTKVTLPDGSFLAYTYNPAHQLTRITDALGNHTDYTLDLAGNVTAENVYDKAGNLKRTVSHAYDAVNRLVKDVGSVGQTTIYVRDANGNVTGITDPNNLKTVNGFDALNRLATSINPNNGKTQVVSNPDDSVAKITDPRGVATQYVYDGLGNQVSVKSPDSGTTTRTFDAGGNVLTSTDARGKTTTNSYDKLNRLAKQLYADGTSATYAYDQGSNGIGHLTTLTDASGTTTWTFDPRGHVLQKQQKTGTVTLTTTNTYTPATGKLATTVLPSGQKLAYAYDPVSRLPSEIDVGGKPLIRSIQYQPFGPVAAWIQGSGTTLRYGRSFDLDGYVSGISFANSAATGGVEAISLTHDLGGRITQIADNTVPTKFFTYDALNEIKGYTATGISQNYLYDPTGNRTQFSATASAASTANYTIDTASNRLLSRNVDNKTITNYTLDAAGNLTGDGSRNFTIDASGHLAKVTAGSATTAYATNGLGERVKKSAASGATIFTQDRNGNITGEYDGNTGAPLQETLYLGKLPVGVIKSGTVYYVNPDHLGAPRTVTAATGAPVWAWNRDPFGNGQPSASGAFVNNLRFPGQYYDAETGLFHNNARDYDSTTGRYIQSDPIGLRGGMNIYAYVGGNPISYSDPSGFNALLLGWEGAEGGFAIGGPWGAAIGGTIGIVGGIFVGDQLWNILFSKPPSDAHDPEGAKAPGKPGEEEGFEDPKGGENWVPNPNGKGSGWEDKNGNVWCPTGQSGKAHGGPHWDVQKPGGGYTNVYPGGGTR